MRTIARSELLLISGLTVAFALLGGNCSAPIIGGPADGAPRASDRGVFRGKLGLPLGELATIRGRCRHGRPEEGYQMFEVTSINGRALRVPIEFDRLTRNEELPLPLVEGEFEPVDLDLDSLDAWEIQGWETGSFRGVPKQSIAQWNQRIKKMKIDIPVHPREFHFESCLEYTNLRILN
jgi:hypothetical protein